MAVLADSHCVCVVWWRWGFGDGLLRTQKFRDYLEVRGAGVVHDGVAWHVHGVGRVGIHRVDPVVERDVGPFGGGLGHSSCGLS